MRQFAVQPDSGDTSVALYRHRRYLQHLGYILEA